MTDRPHILVTGPNGFLGQHLTGHAGFTGARITGLARHDADIICDLADTNALIAALEEAQPDIILNLAALTSIKACEENPVQAMAVNALAVEVMADWCHKNETRLVQISTDHVFSRGSWKLHDEESVADPPNQYGISKLAGEKAALACNGLVLRTHFMGLNPANPDLGFAAILFASLTGRRPMPFFLDSYATPLHVSDFCDMLITLIDQKVTGLVHLGGKEPVSRYGLAATVAAKCGLDVKTITAGSVDDIDLPLGKDLGLDCGYASWLLDRPMPDLARLADLLAKDFDRWQQATQTLPHEVFS